MQEGDVIMKCCFVTMEYYNVKIEYRLAMKHCHAMVQYGVDMMVHCDVTMEYYFVIIQN